MRAISITALGLSALALSACTPTVNYNGFTSASAGGPPLRSVAALDCPETQGALSRTARAPDGRSCDYEGRDGETVRLMIVTLDGRSAADALAPTKAELSALVPPPRHSAPSVDVDEAGDRADVDLPFFHVHAVGDRADVRIFGVSIHSEGQDADVTTHRGGSHTIVHASRDGAEVMAEDVSHANASMVYVLASDRRTPSGYHAVGYVAKGPADGPLVVGEFRATRRSHGHSDYTDRGDGDIGRLIDRNVRG